MSDQQTKNTPSLEQVRSQFERAADIAEARKKGPVLHGSLNEFEQAVMGYLSYRHKLGTDALEAEEEFKRLYPPCNLSLGIRGFLIQNWHVYMGQL